MTLYRDNHTLNPVTVTVIRSLLILPHNHARKFDDYAFFCWSVYYHMQLERLRLQSLQQEQDHRARHADCEAQLVRVRSELSRLRQSYEQLKAKRGQSKPSADSGGSGATNYRQECHSLRRQLTEGREREKEMERQCGELREMVRKRDMQLEGLEVERRQSQQGVAYLQETVKDREGMIRSVVLTLPLSNA